MGLLEPSPDVPMAGAVPYRHYWGHAVSSCPNPHFVPKPRAQKHLFSLHATGVGVPKKAEGEPCPAVVSGWAPLSPSTPTPSASTPISLLLLLTRTFLHEDLGPISSVNEFVTLQGWVLAYRDAYRPSCISRWGAAPGLLCCSGSLPAPKCQDANY